MRVSDLADWLQSEWEGDGDLDLRRAATIEDAGREELAFLRRGRSSKAASVSGAGCLLVPLDFVNENQRTIIRAKDPRSAIARAISRLYPRVDSKLGIHPTAVIGPGAVIGIGVSIGAYAVIGAGVRLGAETQIGPGCVIGDYVRLGARCLLYPRVSIYKDVSIGRPGHTAFGLRDRRGWLWFCPRGWNL